MKKLWTYIDSYRNKLNKRKRQSLKSARRNSYLNNGKIPWSEGYWEFRQEFIQESLKNESLLEQFRNGNLHEGYGYRLDERCVEYPWIFSRLSKDKSKLLDAGSTFNFKFIVNHKKITNKELTIFTFAPEEVAFFKKRISYVYGDLREMMLKSGFFDVVVSQSTIEHIDMDNSVYGYELEHNKDAAKKSYEYLKAINEMVRVLKPGGKLLLTFPFGKFEHHEFFQQFDEEMIGQIFKIFQDQGQYNVDYFRYFSDGWQFATVDKVKNESSHNPHTGKGAGDDHAAHSRAIACIEFIKHK